MDGAGGGEEDGGTVQAVDNANVSAPLTTEHNLFAIRKCGKGYLAISGIHSYYTLTDAYSTAPNLGENNTGRIDGIVLHGEKGGRPSDFLRCSTEPIAFWLPTARRMASAAARWHYRHSRRRPAPAPCWTGTP